MRIEIKDIKVVDGKTHMTVSELRDYVCDPKADYGFDLVLRDRKTGEETMAILGILG